MPNLQLALNLQYLRISRNLTQKSLSDTLSISRQAYSNYETCKRTPDLDSLLHLVRLYRVNLDDLVLRDLKTLEKNATIYTGTIKEENIPYIFATDENTGNSAYVTDEELEFLMKYRTLSSDRQQIITGFINDCVRQAN